MRCTFIIVSVVIASLVTTAPASSHPADGYEPQVLDPSYGDANYGLSPGFNVGELVFHAPFPDPAGLSDAEIYMIAGCGRNGPGYLRHPWIQDICMALEQEFQNTGQMPSVLTEEMVLKLAADPECVDPVWVDHFKSPLTEEFPRFDAAEFAAGNLYIHVLTQDEMQYLAKLLPDYQRHWYDSQVENPFTGEWVPAHINGPVYYYRVYGESAVIDENIVYNIQPDSPFEQ